MADDAIANLTHHQNITDALLNTMGECMAVQQALLHIPPYDGKNMSLKTFLQDVENGLAICPEGIQNAFFKGVIAKLRDTARDAVSGREINTLDALKDALKEYFAPKKTYTHYCAEIQGIRMRKAETVMEYYSRIKRIMESAKASLRDKFTAAQVPHMTIMLEGIALESFKRGLSDDLLYAMSVQEPETLDDALRIAQRVERDMGGINDRRGTLNVIGVATPQEQNFRQIRFSQDRGRSPSPYQDRSTEQRPHAYVPFVRRDDERRNRSSSPYRGNSPYQNRPTDQRHRDYVPYGRGNDERRNRSPSPHRGNSPYRPSSPNGRIQNQEGFYSQRQPAQTRPTYEDNRQPRTYNDSRLPRYPEPGYNYPLRWPGSPDMQMAYSCTPPMPYNYQYPGPPFYAPPPQSQFFYNQPRPSILEAPRENLNSKVTRQQDALTSEQKGERPITVKFLSAEDLIMSPQDEE